MITRLIRFTLILAMALGVTGYAGAQSQATDHPKSATTKSEKSRGASSAPDENIKHDNAANDPNAKIAAPPAKGGTKTRGGYCRLHVDNQTQWYISVYFDGDYRGQVSPWGDSYGWVGCGDTKLYGKATFTDGSVLTWGPQIYYINGTFTWTLN
jgi:hypothetical protein